MASIKPYLFSKQCRYIHNPYSKLLYPIWFKATEIDELLGNIREFCVSKTQKYVRFAYGWNRSRSLSPGAWLPGACSELLSPNTSLNPFLNIPARFICLRYFFYQVMSLLRNLNCSSCQRIFKLHSLKSCFPGMGPNLLCNHSSQ